LRLERSPVQLLAVTLLDSEVVHAPAPLSPSSIIWYKPRGSDARDWDSNRRFVVMMVSEATSVDNKTVNVVVVCRTRLDIPSVRLRLIRFQG